MSEAGSPETAPWQACKRTLTGACEYQTGRSRNESCEGGRVGERPFVSRALPVFPTPGLERLGDKALNLELSVCSSTRLRMSGFANSLPKG